MSKVFTPQDANEILPEVKRRFNKIISQKNHVVSLQEKLQKIVESGLIFDPFIKKKQEVQFSSSSSLWRYSKDLRQWVY